MATHKAYLFAALLAAVCGLMYAYCPAELYPDYCPCVCASLYRRFEKAMLDNKNNLYRLHTEFFPPGYSSPVYGSIIYDIHVPCQSEPESRSENGTLLQSAEVTNSTLCDGDEHFETVLNHWSSSLLLAHVDPIILNSFQLHVVDLIFKTVGTFELASEDEKSDYSLFKPSQVTVRLRVTIDNVTHWGFSENITDPILEDMTSWLKMYAVKQTSIDEWDGMNLEYKGYSGKDSSDSIFVKVPVLLACIDVLFVLLLAIVFKELSHILYDKLDGIENETTAGGRSYCFFWALGFITFLLNVIILAFDIQQMFNLGFKLELGACKACYHILHGFNEHYRVANMAKTISILRLTTSCGVIFFIDLPIAIYNNISSSETYANLESGRTNSHNCVNFPIPCCLQYISEKVFCGRNSCCKFLRLKFPRIFALWNIYVFLHYVSITLLPLLLWVFVLPIRTFTMLTLLASTIFCVAAFTALLIKYLGNITNYKKKLCSCILRPVIILLFLATVLLTSLVYNQFITAGLEANGVGGFLVSFLPSVVLTALGWFITWKQNYQPREEHKQA